MKKHICPFCGKKEVEIMGGDDCSIDIFCHACKEDATIEPDGLGEGGMEWVEAMMKNI